MAGALVTARHLALARSTTVYADAAGRYTFPPLEPGLYHLRVRRAGFRDRSETVDIGPGATVQEAVGVERETDPRELAWQLPSNYWFPLVMARNRSFQRIASEELRRRGLGPFAAAAAAAPSAAPAASAGAA